jgi:N-methylhydantoinase B
MIMQLDPVTLEILVTKVAATAEEMGIALQRSGRTIYVKETQDFGTGLVNHAGRLFCFPTSVGVCNMADNDASVVIAAVPDLEPGDVIITNHPYLSGGLSTHLPDLHLLAPYFHAGKIVCYGWCFIHCADVGGRVPSSISPSNHEIYQEGLMIPPLKLVKARAFNPDVTAFIAANCRTAEENLGDLKAMVASLAVGERRVEAIIARHGIEAFTAATTEIIDYTSRKARDAFRTIPDGVYRFADYLDDDLVSPLPIRIHATMRVADGLIDIDFTGTDAQILAAFNLPSGGKRHTWLTLRLLQYALTRDPSLPINAGVFAGITMTIPQGSLLNPDFPAAVGVRHATGNRIVDVINGLLAQAVPAFMRAAGCGLIIPVVLAEPPDVNGKRKVDVVEPMTGGTGGMLGMDGVDARDSSTSGMANNPVETVESSAAATILRYGIRPDSGGPGKWRGGVGLELTFTPHLSGSQVLGRGMERIRFVPWGFAGGRHGTTARTVRNLGEPGEQELGKIDMIELDAGETISVFTPGGGGYGNPLERDPARVLADVRNGFVTIAGGEAGYGVIIRDDAVDDAATAGLRAARGHEVTERRSRAQFDFGAERMLWESVFDDALMARIIRLIYAQPTAARQTLRRRIYRPALDCIKQNVPFDAVALQQARPAIEAVLNALEPASARDAAA